MTCRVEAAERCPRARSMACCLLAERPKDAACLPIEPRIHLYFRVNAFKHRAGQRGPLQDGFVLVRNGQRLWKVQDYIDPRDSPGIRSHVFGDVDPGALEVQFHVPGLDTHDGHHTTAQCGSHKVGGGEAFPLALVIGGGVGFDLVATLEVGRSGAKVSFVYYC